MPRAETAEAADFDLVAALSAGTMLLRMCSTMAAASLRGTSSTLQSFSIKVAFVSLPAAGSALAEMGVCSLRSVSKIILDGRPHKPGWWSRQQTNSVARSNSRQLGYASYDGGSKVRDCGSDARPDALELHQGSSRIRLCSFECVIAFSVDRIRERRFQHNEQVAALTGRLPSRRERRSQPNHVARSEAAEAILHAPGRMLESPVTARHGPSTDRPSVR